MLILTRKIRETVCIGKDIRVTVLAVPGQYVRLGFCAPRAVSIHREEVFDRLEAEKAAKNDGTRDM